MLGVYLDDQYLVLLVETEEVSLALTMQTLHFTYAQYDNARYRKMAYVTSALKGYSL